MNKPLSCHAQDLLEAAIIQRRRLNLHCLDESGVVINYPKILPIDVTTSAGEEHLTFMTTDNGGGIIKLSLNTALIVAFEADDFFDPRIEFKAN